MTHANRPQKSFQKMHFGACVLFALWYAAIMTKQQWKEQQRAERRAARHARKELRWVRWAKLMTFARQVHAEVQPQIEAREKLLAF